MRKVLIEEKYSSNGEDIIRVVNTDKGIRVEVGGIK